MCYLDRIAPSGKLCFLWLASEQNLNLPRRTVRLTTLDLMPQPPTSTTARRQIERRRQVRGLLLLAIAILIFSILRTGTHNIFTPGWWRLW
jgi:hypothetical protein